jgi:hypothetical protein
MEIEESVINKIRQRRDAGRQKYGVSMEREDMTRLEWLLELQAELLDGAIYAEKNIREEIKRMGLEEMPADKTAIEHALDKACAVWVPQWGPPPGPPPPACPQCNDEGIIYGGGITGPGAVRNAHICKDCDAYKSRPPFDAMPAKHPPHKEPPAQTMP